MKIITNKKLSIVAQYALWAIVATSSHEISKSRFVILIFGFFIILTLLGINLQKLLVEIPTQAEQVKFIALLVFTVGVIFCAQLF